MEKKQKQNKKRFNISFISLVASVVMFFLVDTQITIDIVLIWMLLSFIGLCIFGFMYLKNSVAELLKQRRDRIISHSTKGKESNNEYECQNCKKILKHAHIFNSKDYLEILAGFVCPNCGFQVYPHFRDTVRQKQSKAWEYWFISALVVFATVGLMSVFPWGVITFLVCIAVIASVVLFAWCLICSMFNPKIEALDKQFKNGDTLQIPNGVTLLIDNLIKNQGIHFNRFLSYQALENSIDIDESLKNTLPEYVKQRIIETGKGDLECLIDESVSTVKKLIFDDYHADMAVIDEEIAQLYKFIPAKINVLRNALEPAPNEISTKAELREEMQYNLIAVNNFYSIQIAEAKKILDFGVKEYCQYNFEDDIKTLENLKYYPDFKVDFDLSDYQEKYNSDQKEAVEFFVSRVLNSSAYPIYIQKEFELEYNPDNGVLALNYKLPNQTDVPNISEVSYIAAKNDFKVTKLKEKELNELYDNILYQIVLRTNFEIFKSDSANHIKAIVFNGWLQYIDKSDGLQKTGCILSMQACKDDFLEINLKNVEPKQCFKRFRGISSSALYNMIPVSPIINLNRYDKRFVEGYEVLKNIEVNSNLGIMPWQDFENLVKELFEKEFNKDGDEVKITQESRDGGVDAIIYDNDYLRGGKIVVQAKRYNNVVGLSAVRDLFGTMEHERAMKGILITTSYYGLDAYEFVKDKPIKLLDGNDLLNMLHRHGYNFKINLEEAKQYFKEMNKEQA